MSPGRARWLAPVAASAAVLATVVLPSVLASSPTSRAGVPGPDRTGVPSPRPTLLVLPDPRPGDRRDSRVPGDLAITGYRASGRVLRLYYVVGPRSDCSTAVRRPRVTETPDAVAVRLERGPTQRPEETCRGQPLRASVDLRLADPVTGRVVTDSARRGALVPREGSVDPS